MIESPASPLISPEALAARLGDPDLRIADSRWYLGKPGAGRAAYDAGHIPGAVFIDIDTDLADPAGKRGRHPLPDPARFAARLGELGIGDDHFVVIYDDAGGSYAARLWWMLDALGHRRVAVLDGGLPAWTAAGGGLTTDQSSYPPAALIVDAAWPRVIDRQSLKDRLGDVTLIDARSSERYRGEVQVDPVPGHIPTARSAPTAGNLDADGRFLAPEQLRIRFAEMGVGGTASEVVSSCGSGVTANHNALAMRLAGLPDPIIYPGSYSEWIANDEPVATGPEPGDPPA